MSFRPPASPFDPPSLPYLFFQSPLKLLLRSIYYTLRLLRHRHKPPSPAIRIVCISDTHCNSKQIPDGDLLIHAGDLTNAGTPKEIQAQVDWLNSLPHRHKIAIAGNHDTFLDPRSRQHLPIADMSPGYVDWGDIHYLQHSSITLAFPSSGGRSLKFYGAPQIPACGGPEFAFQYARGQDAWSDTIPSDIDVLITHTPPKYHLDLPAALGCEHLLREIWRVKPMLHVFGHVHAGRGQEVVYWDAAQKVYEAGLARRDGFISSAFDIALWTSTVRMVVHGATASIWELVWGGKARSSLLVNASLMYNNTGQLLNEAQVVDI